MRVAVLALQGAFIEHEAVCKRLGAECIELREKSDLDKNFGYLILPGGESTVQGKLLRELDMFEGLKKRIQDGMPVLATCAGLILLAQHSDDGRTNFATLPVSVKRNAYGRQLGSFYTSGDFAGIGNVPMTFIRAPAIESVSPDVQILARHENTIVAVKYKNQLAMAFHPELGGDDRIHKMFLELN